MGPLACTENTFYESLPLWMFKTVSVQEQMNSLFVYFPKKYIGPLKAVKKQQSPSRYRTQVSNQEEFVLLSYWKHIWNLKQAGVGQWGNELLFCIISAHMWKDRKERKNEGSERCGRQTISFVQIVVRTKSRHTYTTKTTSMEIS